MTLSELQAFIGELASDPSHDRYSLSAINTELDNTQRQWNQEIKIVKETTTITAVTDQRQYLLTLITGTPLSFPRATFRGNDLQKRSKSYFDLYNSTDWTLQKGTPTDFMVEGTDASNLYLTIFPNPQSNDAGDYLVVETIIDHTPMSAGSDVPFMNSTESNYLIRPYDFYLGYDVARRLLARDPSDLNRLRATEYKDIANEGKALITNVFKALEAQEPARLRGGRRWKY